MKMRIKRPARLIALVLVLILIALICVYVLNPYLMRRKYMVRHADIIAKHTEAYDVDPYLTLAMIYCESTFNADALSHAGARGLMQIMPDTGAWLAPKINLTAYDASMLYDPDINVQMGCWYVSYLINRFNGETKNAVAAFHSGQGTVDKWLADPAISSDGKTLANIPQGETSKYVTRVFNVYEIYKKLYQYDYE